MIFQVNPQPLLSGNKMEKSNYKEWSVDFNGKTIKVSNWWNWEGKGSADLYLDNEHLDQNTEMLVNPNKAMLSKSEFSDDIKSIEVFSAGSFSVKLSIMVNGIVVLQDKLSLLDRFVKTFFSKK
jgi:hypothetical protein